MDGRHIEAICEHLEAVSRGEIKRLIINVPPRNMKSLLVSVFWPAWDWLTHSSRQFLYSSYVEALSIRDSVRCRRVVQSKRYNEILSILRSPMMLVGDQNTKIKFENNMNGARLATSVDGALTGEGGDIIVVDDPHNVREGESEARRQNVLAWWDESMSSRLNDARTGAYVIIMQRVHQQDLVGHILEREADVWDHLCLPARFETNRVRSSLGYQDFRTKIDEPLWPERFDEKELTSLERSMGPYAVASQLQQRPSPRSGGMFKVELIKVIPNFTKTNVVRSVRYWDKAGTEKRQGNDPAYTCGVLMHLMRSGQVIIEDVIRGRWESGPREARMRQAAEIDGHSVEIWIEQEPGSGGKESAQNSVRNLLGFNVHVDKVSGSKELRADPFAAQVDGGNVSVVRGEWVPDYIKELSYFPAGKFKDQVDGSSGAFNKLVLQSRVGTWGGRK